MSEKLTVGGRRETSLPDMSNLPLDRLAHHINEAHDVFERSMRQALTNAKVCGEWLLAAKAKVEHGEWLPWLAQNCPRVSARTAQKYMRVVRCWDEVMANTPSTAHLTVEKVIDLLTVRREPDEADDAKSAEPALLEAPEDERPDAPLTAYLPSIADGSKSAEPALLDVQDAAVEVEEPEPVEQMPAPVAVTVAAPPAENAFHNTATDGTEYTVPKRRPPQRPVMRDLGGFEVPPKLRDVFGERTTTKDVEDAQRIANHLRTGYVWNVFLPTEWRKEHVAHSKGIAEMLLAQKPAYVCQHCKGEGTWKDEDGNDTFCQACRGQGWKPEWMHQEQTGNFRPATPPAIEQDEADAVEDVRELTYTPVDETPPEPSDDLYPDLNEE